MTQVRMLVDATALDAASSVLKDELADITKYTKIGWGWSFNKDGFKFFVRKTKTGLSIVQDKGRPQWHRQ